MKKVQLFLMLFTMAIAFSCTTNESFTKEDTLLKGEMAKKELLSQVCTHQINGYQTYIYVSPNGTYTLSDDFGYSDVVSASYANSYCNGEFDKLDRSALNLDTSIEEYYLSNPDKFVWNKDFNSWQYIIKSDKSNVLNKAYNPPVYLTDPWGGQCSVSYYMESTNTYSSPQIIWCCDVPGVTSYVSIFDNEHGSGAWYVTCP